MNLFLTEVFISVDMLSPIIYLLKKDKINVGVLNCNCIQDHSNDDVLKYLINIEKIFNLHYYCQDLSSSK